MKAQTTIFDPRHLSELELRLKHAGTESADDREGCAREIERREAEDQARDLEIAQLERVSDTSLDAHEIEAALRKLTTLRAEVIARKNALGPAREAAEAHEKKAHMLRINAVIAERTALCKAAMKSAIEAAHAVGRAHRAVEDAVWFAHSARTELNPSIRPFPSSDTILASLEEVSRAAYNGQDRRGDYTPSSPTIVAPKPAPVVREMSRREAFALIGIETNGRGSVAQAIETHLSDVGRFRGSRGKSVSPCRRRSSLS